MKNTTKSRLIALLLVFAMMFSLAACGSSDSSTSDIGSTPKDTSANQEDTTDGAADALDVTSIKDEDLSYVMIYNPKIYSENAETDFSSLGTGYLGAQVNVDANRADGLEEETPEYLTISQSELDKNVPWDKINLDGNRVEGLGKDYNKGDKKEFYIISEDLQSRELAEMECLYAGEYCYIWSNGNSDEKTAKIYGDEFDSKIFNTLVDKFGRPRFVTEFAGKVNIFLYPLADGYLGVFTALDIFDVSEVTPQEIIEYGINTNHAIICINSEIENPSVAFATLAHEFQHLICCTSAFSTVNCVYSDTWFNEGMSGFIEEQLYNGTKEEDGHYYAYNTSGRIRNGQSLYNFDTDVSYFKSDIGVYGSVYYYTEYLANLAGEDVFTEFYEYWRDSYSETLCNAEAIYNIVPESEKNEIDSNIKFSDSIKFNSKEEEFLSKLTLDFYLSVVAKEDIKGFENIKPTALLYDSIDEAKIEGGGRIIISVDEEFIIPEDAEPGLIYVGLDDDFKPVTDIICK